MPIVDLIVLDRSKLGTELPDGYEVIDRNLNEGGNAKIAWVLAFKRSDDEAPITDVHVVYGGSADATKGVFEPTPRGHYRIPVDINYSGGGRDIFITYRKGNSAPIVDLAVWFMDRHETLAHSYRLINKDCNRGRGRRAMDVLIAYRKGDVTLNPERVLKTICGREPITEIMVRPCLDLGRVFGMDSG